MHNNYNAVVEFENSVAGFSFFFFRDIMHHKYAHKWRTVTKKYNYIQYIILKIKSVAYTSQGSHTGQLDLCN